MERVSGFGQNETGTGTGLNRNYSRRLTRIERSREQSRDLVFERSKAVTPDQMEVLEIVGKSDQSGH